jgi:hypothetical protein
VAVLGKGSSAWNFGNNWSFIKQIFLVLSGVVLFNSCTEKEGDALVALSFQPSAMTVNE